MTRREWLAFSSSVAGAVPVFAQQPPKPPLKPKTSPTVEPEEPVIRVDVDVVNVLFSARDKRGGLISTLAKEDVTVFEDGKQQEIRTFLREADLPLTIGLLVDVSRSQENLIEVEKRAASAFFKTVLKQRDMAFLISFGSDAELLQDLTSSTRILETGLQGLRVDSMAYSSINPGTIPTNPRGTILYDAIFLAAEDRLKGEVGRKVIVLITDGMDQGSRKTLQQAVESAHKADAIIYSIYYVDPSVYHYNMFGVTDSYLKKLSEETGGRLFRVDKKLTLDQIFQQIQEEMRSQFALSYTSSNPVKDGGFRKLEIRPKNKETKIQARRGYYATKA